MHPFILPLVTNKGHSTSSVHTQEKQNKACTFSSHYTKWNIKELISAWIYTRNELRKKLYRYTYVKMSR